MKNLTKRICILILFVSIVMFSIATVTASEVSTTQTYTASDDGVEIEAKYKKVSTNTITFNANGGKIGSKNTFVKNINKGAKISKFPASPKRTGYNFKGWYTKKSGGTKITVNTKPTKSVTYFAQWKKGSISEKSKIVGHWRMETQQMSPMGYLDRVYHHLYFYDNGKFQHFYVDVGASKTEGKYSVSNGKVVYTEMKYYGDPTSQHDLNTKTSNMDKFGFNYPKYQYPSGFLWDDKMTTEYKLGSDKKGKYLQITEPRNVHDSYTLESASKYYLTTNNKLP